MQVHIEDISKFINLIDNVMKKSYMLLLFFMISIFSFGQIIQKGQILEYNGRESKTKITAPIAITVVGAPSTVSSSETGGFSLNFANNKMGDRLSFVNGQLPKYIGYELFNTETLNNWNLSASQTLNVVFCKKSKFREYVDNYYSKGNESYELQLNTEKQKLDAALKKNEMLRKEYDKKINELEEFYDEQLKNLRNYAERFARIDLSELSVPESQAIDLFSKGDIQGAIKIYEDLHLNDKLDVVLNNIKERNEAIQLLKEENSKDYSSKIQIVTSIINQTKAYYMAGGRSNLEKVCNLLTDVYKKDTLNIDICYELGNYYKNTGNLQLAECYLKKAAILSDIEQDYIRACSILDYIASVYLESDNTDYLKYYEYIEKGWQVISENMNKFDITTVNDFKTKLLFASYYAEDYKKVKKFSEEIINYYQDSQLQTKDEAARLIIAETYLGFVECLEGKTWESISHCANALYINDIYNVTYNDDEEQRDENGKLIYDYSYESLMSKTYYECDTPISKNSVLDCLFFTLEMCTRGYGSYHDFDNLNQYSQENMHECIKILNRLVEVNPNWIVIKEAKGVLQIHANRIRDAYNTMLEIKDYSRRYNYSNRDRGSYLMFFFYYYGYYINTGDVANYEEFGYIAPDDPQFLYSYEDSIKITIDGHNFRFLYQDGIKGKQVYDFAEPYRNLPESENERLFDKIAKVYKKDKVGLIDESGNSLIPCKYDEIIDFYDVCGKDTLICFARKGEKWQILSNKPNLSSKLVYDGFVKCGGTNEDSYFYGDYVCARKNDKLLILNIKTPSKTLSCEFDSVGVFWHNNSEKEHLLVKRNNKYNILKLHDGNFVFSEFCDSINCDLNFSSEGSAYDGRKIGFNYGTTPITIPYRKNGRWGFASVDNEDYIPCKYDCVTEFFENWEYARDLYLSIVKKDGKYGLITSKGEYNIECKYDSIEYNYSVLVVKLDMKYGVYTLEGVESIPIEYKQIIDVGKYFLCLKDESWYLYSDEGHKFGYVIEDIYVTGRTDEVKIGDRWCTIEELVQNERTTE